MPPPGGDISSAVTAPRVLRGGSHARPPRPRGGGGDFPPPRWPAPFPSLPCAGTDVRLAALGRAGGERIAIRKTKGKRKKKVDLPEGLGGKSLLWGLPCRGDYVPPSNAAGGERRARTTGGLPAAAPGLISALSSLSGRKSALHFRELLKEIQAAGAITAHFNY